MDAPLLRIRLLGELELRLGDAPLALGSRRAEALLAYLLVHRDGPHSRARLAGLLWPDSPEDQARTNLRHLLHTLRRSLPDADAHIGVTNGSLRWSDAAPFWLDLAAFESALDRAEAAAADGVHDVEVAARREAAALYRRDLLEAHDEDWVLAEREGLRQRQLASLERLAVLLEASGDTAEAVVHAERLVRDDPIREEPYRLLMRLHASRGDAARALRVYHACAGTLAEELGVDPSPATRAAYEALLRGGRPATAAGPAPRSHDGRDDRSETGLIGRTEEHARLVDLWRATRAGRARLVVVAGEAGVGKTRLVEEFRAWVDRNGAATALARSYQAEGELAFGPVVAWLRCPAYARRLDRLAPRVRAELAGVLPDLGPDAATVPSPAPDRRQATFDALATALRAAAPAVLVADDLAWADRDTLQFLHYLLRSGADSPLLIAATMRDEELDDAHPAAALLNALRASDALVQLELGRFSAEETAALAAQELGWRLPLEQAQHLHADTEGNPLFVLEALRAGWHTDRGVGAVLTPRVQAVIGSRIERLSQDARDLLGTAATVGRAFSTEVLAAARVLDEGQLVTALDELWRRRLIRDQGADAYDFSHDRIREVAYATLGPAQRRRRHLQVAVALEELHRADPGRVAAQVAAHREAAGDTDGAIHWYEVAAAAAQRVAASAEAVHLLDRGLALLATLPPRPHTRARELAFLTALVVPLGAVEGWSSPRLETVRDRALALAHELGVDPGAPLLHSLGIARVAQGAFEVAADAAARIVTGEQGPVSDAAAVQQSYLLGIAAYWDGRFEAARGHFEDAVAAHRPEQVPTHLAVFDLDPKVACLSRLGNTLWFLGQPTTARATCHDAIAFGREVGHGHSLGIAHVFAGLLAVELRDPDMLRTHVAALEGDAGLRIRPSEVSTATLRAYLDVVEGRTEAGVTNLVGLLTETGEPELAPGLRPAIVRVLLEACCLTGDTSLGIAVADRGLAMGGSARLWEAELRRLRAELRVASGAPTRAVVRELRVALDVARSQGARAYELRVLTSLLRVFPASDGDEGSRGDLRVLLEDLPELVTSRDGKEAVALLNA